MSIAFKALSLTVLPELHYPGSGFIWYSTWLWLLQSGPQPSWGWSKNPVRALSLSEKIKWKNCAMPFISVSRFQFVLLFLLLFVTSYNQDFYAKRKAYKRLLFLLPMKAEEADPKVSAGRKPYFCFHWQILKPTGFLRVMMVTFLPSIKSADSHTDIFHVIPWNRYISWNLFLPHHFLLMLEQAIPLTDNMT